MSAIRVLLSLWLVACRVNLDLDERASIRCTSNEDCPTGRVCALALQLCTLPGVADNDPPTINQVTAIHSEAIRVSFSEPLAPDSLALASNYALSPALEIHTLVVESANAVLLSVSPQTSGVEYTLTVSGVRDLGDNAIANTFTFTGVGPPADAFAPDPLLPGAIVYTASPELRWTARERATHYEVSVARDSAFSDLIAGSPFIVSETSLVLSGLEARTYFWRVRSNATEAGKFGQGSFDVLIERVRVRCDADPCGQGGVGNLSKPLQSVARAVLVAAAHGLPRVDIAMRPNGLAYEESVVLSAGVSLYGGYFSDFNEATRDPVTARTRIRGTGAKAVAAVNLKNAPMRLEGLRIEGSTQDYSQALAFFDCDDSITVSHCDLIGATGSGIDATGINLDRMSGTLPLIEDCVIEGGEGYDNSYGINITFASAHLRRNVIRGRTANAESFGIRTDADSLIRPGGEWTNNIIIGGTAASSVGADTNRAQVLTNNVISGGNAALRIRVPGALVTNNILLSPQTCIRRMNNVLSLASLHHNALADCVGAGASCFNATCTPLTGNLNDAAAMLGGSAPATAIAGNVNAGTSAALFVASPDYHLLDGSVAATGGLDTSQNLCGAAGTASCGNVTNDFEQHPRTPPYAIGAFEK